MSRSILLSLKACSLICILMLQANPSRAGFDHAYANAITNFGTSTGPQNGANYARSDAVRDLDDAYLFVHKESFAEAGAATGFGLSPESLLRFAASVAMDNRGGAGGAFEGIGAEARWDDRFTLTTSPSPAPFDLIFQFSTRGVMSITEAYSLTLDFHASINAGGSAYDSRDARFGIGYAVGSDQLVTRGFDSIKFVPTNVPDEIGYEGLINLRIPYRLSNGIFSGDISLGNSANVEAEDNANNGHGSTTYINSSHSSGLRSVLVDSPTLGLVTPESLGWRLTFDSGLPSPNASPVPEPASFVMLGTGAFGLLGYTWKRRRAAHA